MRIACKEPLWRAAEGKDQGRCDDVRAWMAEVEAADWAGSSDVTEQFPAAEYVGGVNWTFRLARSGVTIRVKILFGESQVIVRNVSR